uniref:Putative HNH homing endonuclease n=1 Tax=Microglena monadina TaxID=47904 RepID=A0A0S2IAX5_9CHLO|nr:putative HNH homing endonuclease [Microglena monadina]
MHPRFKGGYARDFTQRSNVDYIWINAVKKMYGNLCVLTASKTNIVVHHLDGWNHFPEKRYDITKLMESLLVKKFIRIFITFTGMVITQKNNLPFGLYQRVKTEFCKNKYNVDWRVFKDTLLNQIKE